MWGGLAGRYANDKSADPAIYQDHIFGVDITSYSISRTKALLTLYAVAQGEVKEVFQFNLFTGNSLDFDWAKQLGQPEFNGFQCIVGNPPYVASRNMDESTLVLLRKWSVAGTGHPDLYIPFFQIGFESLSPDGILGLITVNTFIKVSMAVHYGNISKPGRLTLRSLISVGNRYFATETLIHASVSYKEKRQVYAIFVAKAKRLRP